jgi:UDP-N-acetylmuramoylalanine-D-glutamate ligase
MVLGHVAANSLTQESDVRQAAFVSLALEGWAFGAVSDDQENHIGIAAKTFRGVEHRLKSVVDADGPDVAGDELPDEA